MSAAIAEALILDAIAGGIARVVEDEAGRAITIASETEDGRSWAGASRALFDHEVRAQVHYADIATDHDVNEAEVIEAVEALRKAAAVAIVAAVLSGDAAPRTATDVSDRLRAVRRSWPAALILAVEEAAEALTDVFRRAADRGAQSAAAEAVRQGLAVDAPLGSLRRARAQAAAAQIADSLVDRLFLSGSAVVDTIRSAPGSVSTIADRLRSVFADTSVKQVVDDARQVTHHAYGEGRMATAETLPEPRGIYGSELLDGNTCQECYQVDGREYPSIAEAMEDYPAGGPYLRCLGGSRCRGTLVFEWV